MNNFELVINDHELPVLIKIEKRRGYRASFTKKGLTIRLPHSFSKRQQQETVSQLIDWAKKAIQNQPRLLTNYQNKLFSDGDELRLFDQTYTLVFEPRAQKSITGRVKGDIIKVYFPELNASKQIEASDLSKILAKHYKAFFKNRLNYWNDCFPVRHKNMRLKYNSSNWGSCSSKSNINLSTRLLLCPLPVIDYVIVHELSHLIHHNHSRKFWNELARVLPDYKIHHKWLKTRGANLDFSPLIKLQPQL